MRHWTYQQRIDFIVKYCDFLSKEALGLIKGGTATRVEPGASAGASAEEVA